MAVLALLAMAAVAHAADPPSALAATDALAILRGLAGSWRGTTEQGKLMAIDFGTLVHGTAVQETQSPSSSDEMVTFYNLAGPELIVTHYCPMGEHGNQPHMQLDRARSTPKELRFAFVSLTNLDPAKDMHVHDGRIVIVDADHIVREWNIWADGKPFVTERFRLTRETAKGR